MRISSLLFILPMLVNLFIPSLEAQGEDTKIMFRKSIVVKAYQDGKVYGEERKVKRGESIWRIYKKNYRIPAGRILIFIKILKEINPQVKDINRIYPNQKIFIPFKLVEPKEVETSTDVPVLELTPPAPTREEKTKVREKIFTALKELTNSLEKTFISSGDYRLLPSLDFSPTIDTSLSPVIELNSHEKIVIDFDETLPRDTREMIKSIQSNRIQFQIINLKGDDKLEDSIDMLLRAFKFYVVERKSNPLLIGSKTQGKVEGDWFVFKDSSLKNIFVINLIEEGKEVKQSTKEVKGYSIKFITLKK
jgi:hypothetical protein